MSTGHGRHNAPSAHHLHLFLALAEELHFRRAAQRVYMSQGAFSQQISSLERRLGLRLVDRTTRHVALTEAGAALAPYAESVLSAVDALQEAARQEARPAQQLRIGAFEAITSLPPVPDVLSELRCRAPELDLEICRAGFAQCPRDLVAGEVDAAFTFLPVPEDVQTVTLAEGPRCVAMSATDPLADRGPLTLADLADHPVIGWSPEVPTEYRRYWSADPRPDGSSARFTAHEVADFESTLPLVAFGAGIQFVPAAARDLYPRAGVSYVEVTDLPPWTAVLAWRADRREWPLVAALRAAVDAVRRGRVRSTEPAAVG